MTTKIYAQKELSFGHLQQVLKLLPDAIAEAGGSKGNEMLVAQGISSVAAGADSRFFSVLMDDDAVSGFMAGMLEIDIFLTRRIAREVFCYLRPSARNSDNRVVLLSAFESWALQQDADRIECIVPADETGEGTARTVESRGFGRASIVLHKRLMREARS